MASITMRLRGCKTINDSGYGEISRREGAFQRNEGLWKTSVHRNPGARSSGKNSSLISADYKRGVSCPCGGNHSDESSSSPSSVEPRATLRYSQNYPREFIPAVFRVRRLGYDSTEPRRRRAISSLSFVTSCAYAANILNDKRKERRISRLSSFTLFLLICRIARTLGHFLQNLYIDRLSFRGREKERDIFVSRKYTKFFWTILIQQY